LLIIHYKAGPRKREGILVFVRTEAIMRREAIMSGTTPRRKTVALILFLLACFAAAGVGVPFTSQATGTWYAEIDKPAWTPPNWVFGPVWTVLYALMAVSAWLVWQEGGFACQRWPLALFFGQLVLNAAWTPIFFGLGRFDAASVEIVCLWCAIVATTVAFARVRAVAAWLLAPYLAWVTYAATLCFGVWVLNPHFR
jgi:tryptophan-rich sensory protein